MGIVMATETPVDCLEKKQWSLSHIKTVAPRGGLWKT